MLESLLADIRFALRWLRRSPAFTLVAVASLAIGIGFNTALFAVADALLFKPLPVAAPERLVDVFTEVSTGTQQFGTSSYPDYLDLKKDNDVFEDLVGYSPMFGAMNLETSSRLAMGEIVTGNYFRVLGVGAASGRTILPEDDVPGAPRVAMVSDGYWKRELGGSPNLEGRTLRIRGTPYTIVGVAPASFTGMVPILAPEMWIPVSASLEVEPVGLHDVIPSPTGATRLERRGDRWMFIRGRLKPGKTINEARANLELLISRLGEAYPATNRGRHVALKATSDVHVHPAADPTVIPIAAGLMFVVGLVLLIACANVASMLLARASGRQKEIGVRLALGASRARLVRQLVTESIVMALIGAVAGTLLAWWATSALAAIQLPIAIPLTFALRIDGRVLLFTLAATLVAGLVAGLAPALQASKPSLVADLRGEQAGSRLGRRRWTLRDGLVAGQMAVTAMLLVVAALLTRSLMAAQRTDPGFPVDRIAVISTDTGMLRYSEERSRQFYEEAQARVRAIPGVESVALATRVPFSLNYNRWEIWVPERHQPGAHGETVEVTTVSPEYFKTIGVPLVEGRAFTNDDRPDTPRVAVVNEAMAHRFWPGERAVGKTIRSRGSDGPVFEIVGVSANHKVLTVTEPPTPLLHVARLQRPNAYSAILARTRGNASALLRDMRRELLALEPHLVFIENQTMEAQAETTLFPVRASAWLVSGVGLVAMLLAAVGLYGVIAYSVARRTREIGIRMALGAQPLSVLRLVMQQGLLVATAGLLVGCLLAAIGVRAIAGALYGVTASDPTSWIVAAAVLLGVSTLANLIPAWRAARVDPSVALRIE
ncbi:MAG TPA: ABC transporter permease [Vicinamibacterales bacterium]|nr:ABC transporter permease [Vicinamibacterales bacterium]